MRDHEEVTIEDGSDVLGINSDTGIREIALEQFRRCIIEGSKEMNRGGRIKKVVKGEAIEIDVPNQREVYVNAVDVLHRTLLADLSEQKDLLKEMQEVDKKIQEIETSAIKKYKEFIKQDRINPKSNRDVVIDDMNDNFEIKKLALAHKKFSVLSLLLKKLNYYSESGGSN